LRFEPDVNPWFTNVPTAFPKIADELRSDLSPPLQASTARNLDDHA
jgi:hypothetical protein